MGKISMYLCAAALLLAALGVSLWLAARVHLVEWFDLRPQVDLPAASSGAEPAAEQEKGDGLSEGKGGEEAEDFYEPCDPADTGICHGVDIRPGAPMEATEQERAAGVDKVTKVELSAEAQALATEGHTPQPGDHLTVQVTAERKYELNVLDVIDMGEGTHRLSVEVVGDAEVSASVLLCQSRVNAEIIDTPHKRIYRLNYNTDENSYTVTEYDMTRLPSAVPH